MKLKLLFIFSIFAIPFLTQSQENNSLLDSVYILRDLSVDNTLSKDMRIEYGKQAVELSKRTKSDSTTLISERKLAFVYLLTGEYELYESNSLNNLETAKKLNDSLGIAYINAGLGYLNTYINLNNELGFKYYLDALKYFDALNKFSDKANALYNIAYIQDDEKDYLGSEQNAISALRILDGLDLKGNDLLKYRILNLLGLVSYKLENFEEAIAFHNQAVKVAENLDNGKQLAIESLNNIAITYREKREFDKALELFSEIFQNPQIKEDMSFYGLVLANYAFTKFLSSNYDYYDVEKDLIKSLSISEEIEDDYVKLVASLDLAKFYEANKIADSSMKYARQTYKIAKAIPRNDYYLEAMIILARLTDGEESNSYLEQHINLSDSLLGVERATRNKFARIEYKTDELEAENEQISKENLYLLILSIGLLLTAIIVYLVISQRAKNRKLKLIQVQSKANEDIYNLIREQQDRVDEARTTEKKRISEELHDGILGRLFGTRLSLDSINFKDGKDAMTTRAAYISQLKTIEEDIRKISHELNTDFVAGAGFADIVSELIANQTNAYNLEYEFDHDDEIDWEMVNNRVKINIYRIIQEAMQNVYKHANAKAIKISISLQKNVICLDIIDDGDGFDTSKGKKGIGLKNMTSRVTAIDGKIEWSSQVGNGTVVNVRIPYLNQST
ncbi:tetratricopeptide repeat-containing sensor histidine kinase [Winogradskyella alexanderae]|uniref:histidine kinase n=1 Tax=Winogradskyella alexanderae TaxID=2877123 RepID=A0ABS7XNL6_9FLAO|nr:tetratricopeptide repeat-containing sensor histidine kinase [Winogradskyella alexanderae]MCA0131583.1 tetratricopeptide repeat protein [Winogradskyella alexanderae]